MTSEGGQVGGAAKLWLCIFEEVILERVYLSLVCRSSAVAWFIGRTSSNEWSKRDTFVGYKSVAFRQINVCNIFTLSFNMNGLSIIQPVGSTWQ